MSKHIICLGDGMADEPIAELNNQTPLEYAHTPYLDQCSQLGQSGWVTTVPGPFQPGSDVANMGILGYDPTQYYTGRGPIEAASLDINPSEKQVIFRCNLVSIQDNIMKDFTANHITTEEAQQLLLELNASFKSDIIEFFTGVSYRHILLHDAQFNDLKTTAPHDILDQDITDYLPQGTNADPLLDFITKCQTILTQSDVNKRRIDQDLLPANSIWPWSQGLKPTLPSFQTSFNKTGSIITAVDLLKGLATLMNLDRPNIPGATGFIDTNYDGKVSAALSALETQDFVYLHIEAPDEAGHMGDAKLKVKAIEDFDKQVIKPVLDYVQKKSDVSLMALPDHPTPCHLKTHTSNPVPFVIYKPGIESNQCSGYNEKAIESSSLSFETPWDLLTRFFSY